MLLIIIKRHLTGTPDYDYVASQLGITKDAARIKFNLLKREFSIADVEDKGLVTPPGSPVKGRKRKMGTEGKEDDGGEKRVVKRERKDAGKDGGKEKERFLEGGGIEYWGDDGCQL